jgi:hypothetical protein
MKNFPGVLPDESSVWPIGDPKSGDDVSSEGSNGPHRQGERHFRSDLAAAWTGPSGSRPWPRGSEQLQLRSAFRRYFLETDPQAQESDAQLLALEA